MASPKTLHYDIFKYWRNKLISEDGNIFEWPKPNGKNCIEVVEDWGEPRCWACGRDAGKFHREAHYEEWLACDSEEGYIKIWNHKLVKKDLNRCHIIPDALGGEDVPSNLFLMCPECHQLSPDTTNPNSFFRWVYRRKKTMYDGKMSADVLFNCINFELNEQGYLNWDGICNIASVFLDDETFESKISLDHIQQFLKEHMGMHAYAVADSSMVFCFTDYFKMLYDSFMENQWGTEKQNARKRRTNNTCVDVKGA